MLVLLFKRLAPAPKMAIPYSLQVRQTDFLTLGMSLFIRHCQEIPFRFLFLHLLIGLNSVGLLAKHHDVKQDKLPCPLSAKPLGEGQGRGRRTREQRSEEKRDEDRVGRGTGREGKGRKEGQEGQGRGDREGETGKRRGQGRRGTEKRETKEDGGGGGREERDFSRRKH